MGIERDAAWYDDVYREGGRYVGDPDESPWAHLHRWAAARVGKRETVLDLGCGVGHLAARLRDRGIKGYVGVDFSAEAVARARTSVPGYTFRVGDIRRPRRWERPGNVVVLCEVLEHVTYDMRILRALQPGTRVLATVPSYDSAGHVRHFATVAAVSARYERAVRLESVTRLGRCYGFEGVALGRHRDAS